MDWFWEFLKGPIGSWLRVFALTVLGFWVADLRDVGYLHFDMSEWVTWVTAALVALLPVGVAALNPKDARFGRGKA